MRYGHGPGGMIGITLNPSALKRWALSLHTCSRLIKDLTEMQTTRKSSPEVTVHKEEMTARMKSDAGDRTNLREKLKTCIDPLNTDDHPPGLINIVSGRISTASVNVDDAVSVGAEQMKACESNWPDGFYGSLKKEMVTMAVSRKQVKMGSVSTFNTKLIFSRVLGLMTSREVDVEDILRYELAPIPTSMFEDNGDMRITKTKFTLKRKLQIEQSARTTEKLQVVVIDGCAILWTIHCPSKGTVQDFVDGFSRYVKGKLSQSEVYLVFDRYYDYSIKSGTRSGRAGQEASRHHKLNMTTPLPPQQVLLNVTANKTQLIDIICEQLLDQVRDLQAAGDIRHRLVVTGSACIPQEVNMGVLIQRRDLKTSHEEADVIIPQQVVSIANQEFNSISVICDDIDVFLLLTYYYTHSNLKCNLLMEGTSPKRAVIDIAATAKAHAGIVPQLLAAHALSGCDTVAYMWGIGKATVVKLLLKGLRLDKLGEVNAQMDDIVAEATMFAAACYGSISTGIMSEVR